MTGGSAGLGLALAIQLTQRGADISIVARNKERLQKAMEQIEVHIIVARSQLSSYFLPGSPSNA